MHIFDNTDRGGHVTATSQCNPALAHTPALVCTLRLERRPFQLQSLLLQSDPPRFLDRVLNSALQEGTRILPSYSVHIDII